MFTLEEKGIWSLKYKRCKKCKTTEKKHRQSGYCVSCWTKVRYKKNKKKFKEYAQNYWAKKKILEEKRIESAENK